MMTPNDDHEFPHDDNPSDELPADFEQNPPEDEFDEFTDLPGLPAPDDLVLDDDNVAEVHAESDTIAQSPENEDEDAVAEVKVNALSIDDVQNFEDLTLAELTGQFLRAPRRTVQAVSGVVLTPSWSHTQPVPTLSFPQKREHPQQDQSPERPVGFLPEVGYPASTAAIDAEERLDMVDSARELIRVSLYLVAFALAWYGNNVFISGGMTNRSEGNQLARGVPFLLIGFVVWLAAEVIYHWDDLKTWFANRREGRKLQPGDQVTANLYGENVPLLRVGLVGAAALFAALAWIGTSNNSFSFSGFWAWMISIVLIVLALLPADWTLFEAWSRFRGAFSLPRISVTPTFVTIIVIMIVGAYFRFDQFDTVPPEMTSDHVEKLLDAERVSNGDRDVFFSNNGGREPFQMYAIALLTRLPGFDMNHATLQFLAVIESLVTLPVLFWMGREIVGERDRKLGTAVGLVLMLLVAVSYWHVSITRLALRIVLTPLVTALLMIYLSRAMRYNRRVDFIIAGLILGFGMYTYQAVRMLPVVVVVGVMLALIFRAATMRMRSRFVLNLAALVLVSGAVFVPLGRFWYQYPEVFWQRTAGRLLGDDVIQEFDEEGNLLVERNATISERLDAFGGNMAALADNIRTALLMYNWKGDVAWINGAPNQPIMDPFTGGLFIVGLAAWLVLLIQRRDVVLLLIPITIFIMLLPSALAIAAPIENPSATRTSGSLPEAYLIAALPLALIAISMRRAINNKLGGMVAAFFVVIVATGAFIVNADRYFDDFQESYLRSSLPYSEAGRILHGFAESGGSYSNGFIIAYEHWWDHRAVGIEAGAIDWPNGIVSREEVPNYLYDLWRCGDNQYRLDVTRDMLFFYNQHDSETETYLRRLFPEGRSTFIESYQDGDDFYLFRAPPLTVDGMVQFDLEHVSYRRC